MNEKYDKNNLNQDTNSKQEQKKYGLLIDYSKFQQKSNNNNNKENIKNDLNNNLEQNTFNNNLKLQNEAPKKNNLDEFFSNDYDSKSSFAVVETKIKENDANNNNNIIKKDSNNLDNIFLNNEDDINLLTINYKDLIKSNINNNNNNNNTNNKKPNLYLNLNEENENKITDKNKGTKTMDNNITKTPKKKNKYDKFINNRNNNKEIERNKNYTNYSNEKYSLTSKLNKKEKVNSYVQLLKHNQNDNKTNSKLKSINNRNENSFILFNGVNVNHNKSNFSDFSNNALSVINNCDNSINVMSVNDDISDAYSIKNKANNKTKKEKILYTNNKDRYNLKPYHKKNSSYDDRMVKKFGDSANRNNNVSNLTKHKNKNKLMLGNKDDKFLKYNNKKNNNNGFKKDYDVINLLDNIKNKYQNQENKFIKKQKNMKTEINILKEKLKELSANEALYQVEIEKLKRRNNNDNSNNINILKSDKDGVNSNEEPFGHKLDNIIQKYNQNQNNNINSSIFSNNINFQLLDIFGLDKSIFEGENISDFNDNNDYIEIFNKYPKLKNFIKLLIKKYKNEKEYRTRLEEKTIDIFANDMKRINFLENKLKKYEPQIRHSKVNPNSSLNYSYDNDNDNSDDNISKNFCKSVDKIL